MKKAFTLIELMVAVGILAIVLSFAGVVFNAGIDTYRTSAANAEIMRNFRAITDRLDADFEGLRKDGEIFVTWVAHEALTATYDGYHDCDDDRYERFDRIMFFAGGDFQSYGTSPMVRGNVARISYMLATDGTGKRAHEYRDMSLTNEGKVNRQEDRRNRILARTQHILTADPDPALAAFLDPSSFTGQNWYDWHNLYEYDKTVSADESLSLNEWKHIPWLQKQDMLAVITDVNVGTSMVGADFRGAHVDPAVASTIHILLCEGVGEFKIQGWYDAESRWVPEVDVDGDGALTGRSDFFLSSTTGEVPGVLYPRPPYGAINFNWPGYPISPAMSEANFNNIPGLGRALKFTFTLFDSKGIIEQGRTFTHIVYLDK